MKKLLIPFLFIIALSGLYFTLDYGGLFRYKINYNISLEEINPDTGVKTYYIRANHWYHFQLVHSEFYYDITNTDSIKNIETEIGEKIKLHLK